MVAKHEECIASAFKCLSADSLVLPVEDQQIFEALNEDFLIIVMMTLEVKISRYISWVYLMQMHCYHCTGFLGGSPEAPGN